MLHEGALGEIYNIGAGNETPNRVLVDKLLALLGKDESSVEYVEDRLGHDRRYSVDIAKITALGWTQAAHARRGARGHRRLVPRQRVVVAPAEVRGADMRVLITGAGGQLGTDLVRDVHRGRRRGGRLRPRQRSTSATATRWPRPSPAPRPTSCVNAGAWTAVDDCESDPDRAWRINALGVRWVADAARRVGAHVVHVSTDYVFDGTKPDARTSSGTPPNPQSAYGRSKLGGRARGRPGRPRSCAPRGCAAPTAATW